MSESNKLHKNIITQEKIGGDSNKLSTNDLFRLADLLFYKDNHAYRHLHNSFDKFIEDTLVNFFEREEHVFTIVETKNKFTKHILKFTNLVPVSPKLTNNKDPMFPSDARRLAKTYTSILYADITQYKEIIDISETGDKKIQQIKIGETEKRRPIVNIPTMIKSRFCNHSIYKDSNVEECKYDPGGYFIVNGNEKIVICQDRMLHNHPMVFVKKNSNVAYNVVQVNSRSEKPNTMLQTISIKMKKDNTMLAKIPILHDINVTIIFRALGIESDKDIIDLCVPDNNDRGMIDLLRYSLDTCINDSLESKPKIHTKEEAIDYLIGKMKVNKRYPESDIKTKLEQKKEHLLTLLESSLFPHINADSIDPFKKKSFYLGYVVNKLLKVELGRTEIDNRDSYCKKRVDNINELFTEIFLQTYKNIMSECDKQFSSRMSDNWDSPDVHNVIHLFKATTFEQGFKTALMLGNWPRRKGVSQMLQRMSHLQLITYLSRVDSQGGASSSKITKPRQLEASSIPFLCGVQTPEHAKVGLIKHLSLIGSLTIETGENTKMVKEFIKEHKLFFDLINLKVSDINDTYKIFLNGEWLGVVKNNHNINKSYDDNPVIKFYADAKTNKLTGIFDSEMTSVVLDHDNKEIRFNTDSGRLTRPVLRVNGDNELILTKKMIDKISLKMTDKGKITDFNDFYAQYPYPIEYIDSEEQPYTMVASQINKLDEERKKILKTEKFVFKGKENKLINRYDDKFFLRYDYCEIHPSLLVGEIVSNIPFGNRNQGPRDIFQYAQGKQGMTIYNTNYRSRTDISYVLYNPDVPVVSTRTAKYTNTDVLPPGSNAIVAISTYTGYNQEDSLIFNKTSVERGLFKSMTLKKYEATITKNQETSGDDKFMNPPEEKTIGMKNGDYAKLNEKGFAPEETILNNGDIIFGKVTPISESIDVGKSLKDSSTQYKNLAPGTVDRIYTGIKNQDGYEVRKALIRSERIPQIGDKFCCYTSDMKVMTSCGWVRFDELTMEHHIATLIDGNTLKYTEPIGIQDYNCEQDIYCLESDQIKLTVTMNHRMWVAKNDAKNDFIIEKAEDIVGEIRKYKKNVENYEPIKCKSDIITMDRKISIGNNKYEMKAFLKLLGLWFTNDDVKHNTNIISMDEEKIYDGISKMCENNKHLPEFVWSLERDECKYLIDGMVLNDEHTIKNKTYCYETSSKQLAEDFQRLCLHAGYSTNIISKHDDIWHMTINTEQGNYVVNDTEIHDKIIPYKGKVYCCTVEGDGVIYVCKNEYPVWCGNSRHGQKGTIGILLDNTDMPHTKSGIRPDIIMNPCAVPSRMTVGQLIECLFGKVGSLKGHNVDGTAFESFDIEVMKNELEKLGYERNGEEYLYNGMTGKKMKTMIFIGPTYYQRLKHMTADKMHARARGPSTTLTRQAPDGRSRDGGLRLGTMERDAVISHGMARFLKERLMDVSDIYSTYVCGMCGLFARRLKTTRSTREPKDNDIYYCHSCKNYHDIHKVIIPYAFKLMVQELLAMNIAPRIRIQKELPH
jgi:DNA-directed RNA polymerase II subunit RPB2